jgi:hypothetical protein
MAGEWASRDWTVSIGTHRSMEMLPACLDGTWWRRRTTTTRA